MTTRTLFVLLGLSACCLHPKEEGDAGSGTGTCGPGLGCWNCQLGDGGAGHCCGAGCVDYAHDPGNCGGCGFACTTSQACIDADCLATDCASNPPDTRCLVDGGGLGTCCRGLCIGLGDLSFDTDCGHCGEPCPLGASCSNTAWECVAAGALAVCDQSHACPPGAECVEDQGDAGGFCQWSDCTIAPTGEKCLLEPLGFGVCCAGSCVDVQIDSHNCGGCAVACQDGEACASAHCVPTAQCADGNDYADCLFAGGLTGTCCGGACVDRNNDPSNCGACHLTCTSGSSCVGGGCMVDGGWPAGCAAASCPGGLVCASWTLGELCAATSCDGGEVPCVLDGGTAGTCCGNRCVDLLTDPSNCGFCGDDCVSGSCGGASCAPVAACG